MNAGNPPPAIVSHRADPVATKPPAVLGDERSRASPPRAVHACLSFLCAVAGSDEGGGGVDRVVAFRGVTVEPQGRRRAIPLGDYVGMAGISVLYGMLSDYTGSDCGGG
jgi:hypothetical protein